jgi:hypothetical protein
MTKIELRGDLDTVVAAQFARPAVLRLRDLTAEHLRGLSPAAKVWLSHRDDRVRRAHHDVDGQEVPANLRFHVPRRDGGGFELATEPRDPHLSEGNREHCRCQAETLPLVIARTVSTGSVLAQGPRVSATVTVGPFPRLLESEYPTGGDGGGGWAALAGRRAADEFRAGLH